MTEQASAVAPATAKVCLEFLGAMAGMGHVPSVFTLKMGRAWSAQPLPAWVAPGPKRQCYQNAGTLAIENTGLTYVEGYAQPPGLPPAHHAWCVDAEGRVIDNTFVDPEASQYFGVPIRAETLCELVEEVRQWGLFAEMMTPETLLRAVDDVQAGNYAVDAGEAEAVRALIKQHA
jgi:hypothetical protein